MGVVYEAVQGSLGRRVALKVLPPGLAARGSFLERFQREARVAGRLHHTHIVAVYGVGEQDGSHFYAMQFIPGQGLDAVLQDVRRLRGMGPAADADPTSLRDAGRRTIESPPPADREAAPARGREELVGPSGAAYYRSAARLAHQAAEALAYAHGQGVVHRDVKPSNLLIDWHGTLWVTDFGLAKADDAPDLTAPDDPVGTLRYMAPERFRGRGDAAQRRVFPRRHALRNADAAPRVRRRRPGAAHRPHHAAGAAVAPEGGAGPAARPGNDRP